MNADAVPATGTSPRQLEFYSKLVESSASQPVPWKEFCLNFERSTRCLAFEPVDGDGLTALSIGESEDRCRRAPGAVRCSECNLVYHRLRQREFIVSFV